MPTAVVSGRVDEKTKRTVDRILERSGKTTGDVIRNVWESIAQTGVIPVSNAEEDEFRLRRDRFKNFLAFVESAPPAPDWFASLTDAEMNRMIADGKSGLSHV